MLQLGRNHNSAYCGAPRPAQGRCAIALIVVWIGLLFGGFVEADNFANVYYDARKDQLVVTVFYRGTNPDHHFSLQWGRCKQLDDGSGQEIVAEVLDSQWQDIASQDFKKTTRFSLADLACRPSTLTLRTAPRFYYTLNIPAHLARQPQTILDSQ
jgi:hypothetical protein